ncbi:MAG: hypothetical protein ACOVLC_09220 [Flavobacterium sp.]
MNLKIVLKSIFDFYLKASFHVAFAIVAFANIGLRELQIVPQKSFYPFVFVAVLVGYNFLKHFHLLKNDFTFLNKHRLLWIVTVNAFISGVFFFWEFTWILQFCIICFAFLTLGYLYFRKFALLKIFYVSGVVVLFTTCVPLVGQNLFSADYVLQAFGWFLMISAWMIPFEIIDGPKDDLPHKTIPQKIGLKKAKWLGYFFLLVFILLQFCFYDLDVTIVFILLVSVLAIYFAQPERSFYYTAFWVEAIPILWWLIERLRD